MRFSSYGIQLVTEYEAGDSFIKKAEYPLCSQCPEAGQEDDRTGDEVPGGGGQGGEERGGCPGSGQENGGPREKAGQGGRADEQRERKAQEGQATK